MTVPRHRTIGWFRRLAVLLGAFGLLLRAVIAPGVMPDPYAAAQGTFKDIGGEAIYINSENRLNWGASIGHIPYLTGFSTVRQISGGFQQDLFLRRIYIDQVQGLARYPFSQTKRVELNGGFTRYGFDTEVQRGIYDSFGRLVDFFRFDTLSPPAVSLWEASGAFVGSSPVGFLTIPARSADSARFSSAAFLSK